MHFTGTIQPIQENSIIAPIDAVIDTVHYHYGQSVKKGQIIFTLNSPEFQRQYNDTLTDYLKSKDSYNNARVKFMGTNELWKSGLLSKNNYLSEKSSLTAARITLMQASRKLSELFEKIEGHDRDEVSKLSFSEFDKVRLALTSKHNLLQIKSPSDGVLLYPPQSEKGLVEELNPGIVVKSGNVIGVIGNLTGIRIKINVPEVDINKIKSGMPATIRGLAFGAEALKGQLISINTQASTTGNAGMPSFSAIVEVHTLNQEQQDWIKVGMSCEVELTSENKNKLLIPIKAVKHQTGQSLVQVKTKKGDIVPRTVITGLVEGSDVVIDSGLTNGEVIMYE